MTKLLKKPEYIINEVISLREIKKSDLEILRLWRNENRKFFVTQNIITPEMQKKWFEDTYSKNKNDNIYVVCYKDEPVGTLSIIKRGNDFEMGRVLLGVKKYNRRGIIGIATEKLLDMYKSTDKSKRVYLEVFKSNKPAISFYEKHGFISVDENEKELVMERYI